VSPLADLAPINLDRRTAHPTPPFILEAYARALPGLANYPLTAGVPSCGRRSLPGAKRRFT
jgi:N-succinyldiaminopimelate aminotransferase